MPVGVALGAGAGVSASSSRKAASKAADASAQAAGVAADSSLQAAQIQAKSQQDALDYLKQTNEFPQQIRDEATREFFAETVPPISAMTTAEIHAEIGARIRKQVEMENETILMLMIGANE